MSGLFQHDWYRGLFADEDCAEILSADAELNRMRQIEIAWVQAQADVGIIDRNRCDRAAAHIADCKIDMQILRDGTAQDGLPVPAFVRELRRASGDTAAIHTGLTSQDVIDTALMLAVQQVFDLFRNRIKTLHDALAQLMAQNAGNMLMGYTRMQPALAITAQDRIVVWQRPLADHLKQLDRLADTLAIIQYGGPVGVRDVVNGDALGAAFADHLGLRDPGHAWHAARHDIADLSGFLGRLSGSLGKIGQDIALMAARGADDIKLSSGGTSSAMPHKQNPILAELLVTLAQYNASQVSTMHLAMIHEQERSGTAWALEWMTLPDMLQCCGRGLSAAITLVGQVKSIGKPAG